MSVFPKYEHYKASDVEWLGEVPNHWEVRSLRGILKERGETNEGTKTDFILSVMKDRGVIPYTEKGNVGNKMSEDITTYKLVCPGDLVINKMNAIIGSLGISEYHGALSKVYFVMQPRYEYLNNRFYGYLFQIRDFQKSLCKISYGIMELRESINFNEFKNLPLPLPPKPEQDSIVAFLDQKTAEIDSLIAKKQRQIELLDEQKAILINRAVTRGLNPDAKLKLSGIEWIGDIPENWGITRFKFCASALEQGWSPQCENRHAEIGSWGVVKVGCVNGGVFKPEEHKALPPTLKADIRFLVNEGDFLVSRANSRELVGSAAIATDSVWRLMLCDKVYRCRISNQKFVPDLVVSLFGIKSSRIQLEIGANGASDSMQNISQDVVKNLWVSLPPLPEQIEIVAYIRDLSMQTLRVKVKVESQIQSLKTLRSTLIAHAVTGRIKVH